MKEEAETLKSDWWALREIAKRFMNS